MRSSSDEERTLTIGEVARRAGTSVSRIRYYERLGLLDAPDRSGGWRRYDPEVLRWLGLADVATQLGFTLAETRDLIEGLRGAGFEADRREELVQRKLDEAAALARRAQTMQRLLEECLESGCLTREGTEVLDSCLALMGRELEGGADQAASKPSTTSRAWAASE